jgi:hypothetical protein
MNAKSLQPTSPAAGISLLVAASLALTLGFACALPLAAFAAIAALAFDLGTAVAAVLAVWLVNQVVGCAFLHYGTDAATLAWGGVLGLLGLASLAAARATLTRVGGVLGAGLAFLAAFAAYEGLLFVIDVGAGLDPAVFILPVVARIFAVNAAAFGAFCAARALLARTRRSGARLATALRSA